MAASPEPDVSGLTVVVELTNLTVYEADGDHLLFVAKSPDRQYSAGLINELQLKGRLRPLGGRRFRGRGFHRIALDAGDREALFDLHEATQSKPGSRPLLVGPEARPVTFCCLPKKPEGEGSGPYHEEDSKHGFANDPGHIYNSFQDGNRWGF